MKSVAFVPIKFNSQRLKDKNFLPLGGKPLCWHIFNTLLQVKGFDQVYVYCSNPDVVQYVPEGVAFLPRPASLDSDTTLGMDIYQAFASQVQAGVYALCHATSPFVSPASVQAGLDKVLAGGHDSAFSVDMHKTFAWYQGQPLNYSLDHIPRTQDLEPVYLENSAFFVFSREVLAMKRRIGHRPFMVAVTQLESIDIDTQDDYDMANVIYNYLQHKSGGQPKG